MTDPRDDELTRRAVESLIKEGREFERRRDPKQQEKRKLQPNVTFLRRLLGSNSNRSKSVASQRESTSVPRLPDYADDLSSDSDCETRTNNSTIERQKKKRKKSSKPEMSHRKSIRKHHHKSKNRDGSDNDDIKCDKPSCSST